MNITLTDQQREARAAFRAFVDAEIAPYAAAIDAEGTTPRSVVDAVIESGYLTAALPEAYGGGGMDAVTYGMLNEEVGRGCSSIRSLMTVHNMSTQAIARWGSREMKEAWLPSLCSAEKLIGFGLSEPYQGSDPKNARTTATDAGSHVVINGSKKWTTYGQISDVYLVLAQYEGKPTAFLVERDMPGVTVTPINNMLGTTGSMVAQIDMENVEVPCEHMVGRPGFGFTYVFGTALDHGRYSVATGSVGIVQACLEASLDYAQKREQFGEPIRNFQLIRQMLSNMAVEARAARLLCMQAGTLRDQRNPHAIMETSIAKYYAACAATRASADAVQLHGANGCSEDYPVARYMRDARVMEIIEGSSQMHQINIADFAYQVPLPTY